MITLIVNSIISSVNRKVYENLTLRELGMKLVELSEKYILVFDYVRNVEPEIACEMIIEIAAER